MKSFKTYQDAGIDPDTLVRSKTTCPECSESRKKKHNRCLHVYRDTSSWHCFHCGWHGFLADSSFKETIVEKKYMLPELKPLEISEKTKAWFAGRGIEERVLEYFKITESIEWMYGDTYDKEGKTFEIKAGNTSCINFPYYEGNTLVNVKFRASGKRFKLSKDAKLTMFNLNAIRGSETAVICEGEIDAMSFYMADQFHVCSVPNGAVKNAINPSLEYLDNSIDHFTGKKKIYIAVDGDEAGQALAKELIRRLGQERCYVVEYPPGTKDANEVLLKYGADAVRDLIRNAKLLPLEGVFTGDELEADVMNLYHNGYPRGEKIGYRELDQLISFRAGEFITVTGTPGSGKSNFIDQVMVRLAARNGWKFGIMSAEQPPELHVAALVQKYIGEKVVGSEKMNHLKLRQGLEFVNRHFFFMKTSEMDATIDGILAKAKELVVRKGVNGLLVDPYNYIEHKIPAGYTETQYISELLTKIKRFNDENKVLTFLVAHPTKIPKDKQTGQYEIPTLYSIAGSAHFYNKTDNGITVSRNLMTNVVTVHVQKVRFSWIGKIGSCDFKYDVATGRYAHIDDNFENEIQEPAQATIQPKIESISTPKPLRFPEEGARSYIERFYPEEEAFDLNTEDREVDF